MTDAQSVHKMIDQICGGSSGKVGESYGEDFTIGGLNVYLSRLVLNIFINQQAKKWTDQNSCHIGYKI